MNERQKRFLDDFGTLSPEWQSAIAWLLYRIELIRWLADGEPYPAEELRADIMQARKNGDCFTEALLLYQQAVDQDRKK